MKHFEGIYTKDIRELRGERVLRAWMYWRPVLEVAACVVIFIIGFASIVLFA